MSPSEGRIGEWNDEDCAVNGQALFRLVHLQPVAKIREVPENITPILN